MKGVKLALLSLLLMIAAGGCRREKPVHATSEQFATMEEKRAFLHQYVTLHQAFESLDFTVDAAASRDQSAAGSVLDCEVRLRASIREADLPAWVRGLTRLVEAPDVGWVAAVPHAPSVADFTWYRENTAPDGRLLGVSPARTEVVYRLRCYPPQ